MRILRYFIPILLINSINCFNSIPYIKTINNNINNNNNNNIKYFFSKD